MKILSFDIEEWYIEKHFKGGRKDKYRQYDELLDWILNTLDKSNSQATFFCVGQLAVEFPEVLKRISDNGHEVGSHSNRHLWISKMTRQEFTEDTRIAVQEIENLIGKKSKVSVHRLFLLGKIMTGHLKYWQKMGLNMIVLSFQPVEILEDFPSLLRLYLHWLKEGIYN